MAEKNNKAGEILFGLPKEKDNYKEYCGKYYVISAMNNPDVSVGKIKYMKSGKIILNPFKGFRYDEKKKTCLHKLIEEDSEIKYNPMQANFKLDPTTKETILDICNKQNKELLMPIIQVNSMYNLAFLKNQITNQHS